MAGLTTHASVDKNFSVVLDFFRWTSALIVTVGHSRAIFFVPWYGVEHRNAAWTALYFVSGWGDYGVLMFFAISGFLVGGGAYEKAKSGQFSFGKYFVNRATRIYIVLLPALMVVWGLDFAGISWLNPLGIYTQAYPIGALPIGAPAASGPANFVCNLLMLQNVACPPFGTAQPLWSLNWEWWSYLSVPLVLILLLRTNHRWVLPICVVSSAVLALVGLSYFVFWYLGVMLALIRFRRKWLLPLAAAMCVAMPVMTRAELIHTNFWTQLVFILSFILLLSQLRHAALPRWFLRFPHRPLANFSYSLYVLHTTFLVFLMACLQTYLFYPRQLQPSVTSFGKYLVLLIVVYATAFCFALCTEANTGKLRNFIRSFQTRKSPA